eukprot:TRINITY_DN14299_c0_g1_i1.p1 TRINITY_DN14299_c0_g1~~TRINITY_DN14299_c0_g1_i1.p1  ORF type:complete len:206 (+),score=21.40 TRINITY_DN14299_c0_g1_i1:171-788(+)
MGACCASNISAYGECRCVPTWRRVQLAISEFPASKDWILPAGHRAYHCSIVFEGQEYCFTQNGIQVVPVKDGDQVPPSHKNKADTHLYEIERTRICPCALLSKLHPFFEAGTYDLVGKNCNTFTDVALALLVSRRLPKAYTTLEALAKGVPDVLSFASGGKYQANPKAYSFNPDAVIMQLDQNAYLGTGLRELDGFSESIEVSRK